MEKNFQRKAMLKIKELATRDNRTILFVSHNMDTITDNTDRCLLLDKGHLISIGKTSDIVDEYRMLTDVNNNNATIKNSDDKFIN